MEQILPQEKADNEENPEGKKKSLTAIIADYNARFGTNHSITEFDLYYQDVQKRIKDQQFPNADLPKKGREKIDITIVVDMLLTGFDSKFLNTLYVDKNLKHHGLIQAFSRTNRVLNGAKPYGNVLDFRGQQDSVDAAIALFSGAKADKAREIWLVDKAPQVIEKLKTAVAELNNFHGVAKARTEARGRPQPEGGRRPRGLHRQVQGSAAAADPTRPVHRPHAGEQERPSRAFSPRRSSRGSAARTSKPPSGLKQQRGKTGGQPGSSVDQLDFEFVLFASALVDYDYIMCLIAKYSQQAPGKAKMSREQLIGLIASDAKFMDERE